MLHAHARTVARLNNNPGLKYLIRDYFSMPRTTALMPALLSRALGQADLVLCLLRLRDAHAGVRLACEAHITALVGHPISIGPGCLLRYRDDGRLHVALDRTPRVVWVTPGNPRKPNTDAYPRWCEYRVGRSTAQLRTRGVKPKDIRLARRRGWIRLEERV